MASLFGGSRASAPTGAVDQARLGEAAMELEAVSDLFTRIVSSCHAKCISQRYAEPELNKGESVCVDRCVLPSPGQVRPDPADALRSSLPRTDLAHLISLRQRALRPLQLRRQVLCRQRKGPGAATGCPDLGTARRHVNPTPVVRLFLVRPRESATPRHAGSS